MKSHFYLLALECGAIGRLYSKTEINPGDRVTVQYLDVDQILKTATGKVAQILSDIS